MRAPESAVTAEELLELARESLARFKVPKHVLFPDAADITLTPSGRPRTFLLSERATAELGLA